MTHDTSRWRLAGPNSGRARNLTASGRNVAGRRCPGAGSDGLAVTSELGSALVPNRLASGGSGVCVATNARWACALNAAGALELACTGTRSGRLTAVIGR